MGWKHVIRTMTIANGANVPEAIYVPPGARQFMLQSSASHTHDIYVQVCVGALDEDSGAPAAGDSGWTNLNIGNSASSVYALAAGSQATMFDGAADKPSELPTGWVRFWSNVVMSGAKTLYLHYAVPVGG